MKTFILTLLLYFSILATYSVYADSTSGQGSTKTTSAVSTNLTATYPASSGSYNKIVLQGLQALPDCTNASNAGLLFMDPTSKNLEMCVNVNTQASLVPFPETCFNRFWTGAATAPPGNCPAGYTQATINGQPMFDQFTTAAGGYVINSTVCCSSSSSVLPST